MNLRPRPSALVNPYDRGVPRTEATPAELDALALDVGWTSIAQFDCHLRKGHVDEMPTPSAVDLRTPHDPAGRNSCRAAALRRDRRRHLILSRQRNAKCFAADGKGHHGARRRRRGRAFSTRSCECRTHCHAHQCVACPCSQFHCLIRALPHSTIHWTKVSSTPSSNGSDAAGLMSCGYGRRLLHLRGTHI